MRNKISLNILSLILVAVIFFGFAMDSYAVADDPTELSGCLYESTHGKHNPHASNFEYKIYVWPDYSVGQMLQNSFYSCKGCNYCCCIIYQHFGNLIMNSEDSCGEDM